MREMKVRFEYLLNKEAIGAMCLLLYVNWLPILHARLATGRAYLGRHINRQALIEGEEL